MLCPVSLRFSCSSRSLSRSSTICRTNCISVLLLLLLSHTFCLIFVINWISITGLLHECVKNKGVEARMTQRRKSKVTSYKVVYIHYMHVLCRVYNVADPEARHR